MAKSKGQAFFERLEAYISRYVSMPDDVAAGNQSAILALWAVHTWIYERFTATPYLTVTASVKEAGKTLCMEVLAEVSRGSTLLATLRPLAIVRLITERQGLCTVFVDEAEKMSSGAVGDLRSIFTTGYSVGGQHMITDKDGVKFFNTFAPKCFALIGDVMDVVRSRSIVVHLERAQPADDFRGNKEEARAIAASLVAELFALNLQTPKSVPMFLGGREREIWTPLFSVAAGLELDAATMARVTSAAVDLVGLKSAERRSLVSADDEEKAATAVYAERAMKDLASVIRAGEPGIWSAVAVERMRAIPEGPWRTYRGEGLTQDTLAGLVRVFGVRPRAGGVRMVKGKGASKAKMLNGYVADDVLGAVSK